MTAMDPMLSSAPHRTVSRRPSSIIPPLWAAVIKTAQGRLYPQHSQLQRQILACISALHTIKSEKKEAFVYESTIFITLRHLYRRYDHFSMRNQPQHQDRSGRFTADLHALRHITDLAPQLRLSGVPDVCSVYIDRNLSGRKIQKVDRLAAAAVFRGLQPAPAVL